MSKSDKPLISVIIAIYNPGKYLRPCLDSIVNQTYKNLEIILVDDGSTDDSLAVCKEYAETDSRVIVHHKENSGVSATRNQGIRLAHGDYFSFIDSDDWLEPDTYEYLLELISTHNVDIVNYEHFTTFASKEIPHKMPESMYGLFYREDAVSQLSNGVMFAWNKLFSKKTIEGVLFNESICRGEDSLFALEAFDKADKVWFDPRHLYHYIQSENSAVRGKFRKSQLTAIKLIEVYDKFYSKKYPKLYHQQMNNMLNLLIMIYNDMCMDKEPLKEEKKLVIREFKKLKAKLNLRLISKRTRAKVRLFSFSPTLSHLVHRIKLGTR